MKKLAKIVAICFFIILFVLHATPAFAQQAFDYTNDPHYQIYYNFARTNLFDGLDLFTHAVSIAQCPGIPTDTQMTKWGISLATHGPTITPNLKNVIYTVVCNDFQSATFKQLMGTDASLPNAKPITIFLEDATACQGAGYTEPGTGNIHLCLRGNENQAPIQFYLTHEFGHVMQDRNYSLLEVPWGNIYASMSQPLMFTLNCNGHWGNPQEECFSDALALYTVYGLLQSNPIEFLGIASNSFSTYSDTNGIWYPYYHFMATTIFDGTTFFPPSTSSNSSLAVTAIKLAHDIAAACPSALAGKDQTVINAKNYTCLTAWAKNNLTAIPQPLDQNLLEDGPGNLQCVAFARAAAALAGHPLTRPTDLGKSGNDAHFYQDTKQPGYTWYSKAQLLTMPQGVQPGDIAVFGPIPPGQSIQNHIGIVSSIIGNGKSWFYLAEANGGSGLVDVSSDRNVPYSATNSDFDGVLRLN